MIRIGVVGCGYFGAEFARAVMELPEAELAVVYSPGESSVRLSRELGCMKAETIEEVLEDKTIDAVIVATPNYLHYDHVLAAARAGKHIFCEKPFALSSQEAKEMVAACAQADVRLMVGHIMHFYSGIALLKQKIEAGELGRILTMHIERTGWEEKKAIVSWKKVQEKSGGHLFHHIHEIDILQWIMGLPTEIYAVGGNLGHEAEGFGDEDDVMLLTASFGNKAFATMQYGSGFRIGNHIIRVNGEKAGAVIDFKAAEVQMAGAEGQMSWPLFKDEQSARAIKALFEKTDGGVSYGSPEERPPHYILEALREELGVFAAVAAGKEIPVDQLDLFNGVSAVNSVTIAEKGLMARRNGVVETLQSVF